MTRAAANVSIDAVNEHAKRTVGGAWPYDAVILTPSMTLTRDVEKN